jgi:hypothetical protein
MKERFGADGTSDADVMTNVGYDTVPRSPRSPSILYVSFNLYCDYSIHPVASQAPVPVQELRVGFFDVYTYNKPMPRL